VSLEAFGVKDLRCLRDTGLVPIRPITVLVGQNSSGKSTFLRALPLLRQSVETARNSPILWDHERYVDFGSLKDASTRGLAAPEVSFQFRVRLPAAADVAIEDPAFDVSMTLAGGEVPYMSAYEIRAEGHEVRWDLDASGRLEKLTANDHVIQPSGPLSLGGKAYLLPTLQAGEGPGPIFRETPGALELGSIDYQTTAYDTLMTTLSGLLSPLFHGRASGDAVIAAADRIRLGKRSAMHRQLVTLSDQNTFRERVAALGVEDDEFEAIASAAVAHLSPYIIEAADLVLAQAMGSAAYLKPLRLNPQRAYRIKNFSVDEVDPDGENLAMFLRSLSPTEAESFARFTQDTLGFETRVQTTGIHAEILVREGPSKEFFNLVDVGFGYSEVLPLAAVLWASCVRTSGQGKRPPPLVVIEQPELHLHPAAQSRLARVFQAAVAGGRARIIVETHSETLINGLGNLIYDGGLEAGDVQIVLFDKDEHTGLSEVSLAGYREDGSLRDWPYGFLSPIAERRARPAAE
jgi:predicted ATPase